MTAVAVRPRPVAVAAVPKRGGAATRRHPAERLIGVFLVVALWQAASSAGIISSEDLAGPLEVWRAGWHLAASGILGHAVWVSLQRVLAGLLIGVPVGAALAIASGLTRLGDDVVDAPMQMLRFVPIIGLQPLIVLWFGIGQTAKVSLIVFGVVFPIYINTAQAVRAIDPRWHDLGRVLGLGRYQTLRRVVLPAVLPGFLVGLRMAVGVAWLILVFAEQINATSGIGFLIVQAESFFQSDVILVGLAVYAVLGLVSDVVVRALERRLLAWEPSR